MVQPGAQIGRPNWSTWHEGNGHFAYITEDQIIKNKLISHYPLQVYENNIIPTKISDIGLYPVRFIVNNTLPKIIGGKSKIKLSSLNNQI